MDFVIGLLEVFYQVQIKSLYPVISRLFFLEGDEEKGRMGLRDNAIWLLTVTFCRCDIILTHSYRGAAPTWSTIHFVHKLYLPYIANEMSRYYQYWLFKAFQVTWRILHVPRHEVFKIALKCKKLYLSQSKVSMDAYLLRLIFPDGPNFFYFLFLTFQFNAVSYKWLMAENWKFEHGFGYTYVANL